MQFDKALEINPNSLEIYLSKGQCFKDMKQYEDAIKCFDKVIDLDKN